MTTEAEQIENKKDGKHHHGEQEFHYVGDQDYSSEPQLRNLPITLWNLPRIILLSLIRLYQLTFSRLMPTNTCRFYPSCSHYGYQAIYKHGVIKGSFLAVWRIMRCNPFTKGGFDPVP